jgi:hypothetical protein
MKHYNTKYDAYYDDVTNQWLEPACGGRDCVYCVGRPSTPLTVPYQLELFNSIFHDDEGLELRGVKV